MFGSSNKNDDQVSNDELIELNEEDLEQVSGAHGRGGHHYHHHDCHHCSCHHHRQRHYCCNCNSYYHD